MSNELTMIVWGVRIDVENAILARFEGLDERFGPNADLNDPHIKTAYEIVERKEVVGVLDIILDSISSDFGKYERADIEKALKIVSGWAKAVGISVSREIQRVKALMVADVREPVLACD